MSNHQFARDLEDEWVDRAEARQRAREEEDANAERLEHVYAMGWPRPATERFSLTGLGWLVATEGVVETP